MCNVDQTSHLSGDAVLWRFQFARSGTSDASAFHDDLTVKEISGMLLRPLVVYNILRLGTAHHLPLWTLPESPSQDSEADK